MRAIEDGGKKKRTAVVSFDISGLPEPELRELFRDLPVKSLRQWLDYYVGKEQYEVCKVIKEYVDLKSK
jgi:hypothetical protein